MVNPYCVQEASPIILSKGNLDGNGVEEQVTCAKEC